MASKHEKDEYLEELWHLFEENKDSLIVYRNLIGDEYDIEIVKELKVEGLINLDELNEIISLTKIGEHSARMLIRSHRLAERMLNDVLGGDFEKGACEFEHIITPELVDSICILLGHPRKCPHGMEIPKGDCCRNSLRVANSSVVPITEMKVGATAKIAYVNCKNDSQLHKLDGLHIRPGVFVKLHQTYPTFVIECENSSIALDDNVAKNICVWKNSNNI